MFVVRLFLQGVPEKVCFRNFQRWEQLPNTHKIVWRPQGTGYKKHMKLFRFTFVSRRAQSNYPLFLTGALQGILYFQPIEFTLVSRTRVKCLKISKTHFFYGTPCIIWEPFSLFGMPCVVSVVILCDTFLWLLFLWILLQERNPYFWFFILFAQAFVTGYCHLIRCSLKKCYQAM